VSDVLTADRSTTPARITSPFEFWPGWLFYTPVVLYWLGLGIRYRNMCLATAANPKIEGGGLCGESKIAILDQVGPAQRRWIASYASLTTGENDASRARTIMVDLGLDFPVVIKPDIGCHGAGVRLINDPFTLERVLGEFPRHTNLLVQEYIPFEGEAGAFYVRLPGEKPRITSLTLKYAPSIVGDGRSTVRQLILADPRAGKIAHLFTARLHDRLDEIIPAGRQLPLVFTGNHCKGSVFKDGHDEITTSLTAQLDEICRSMPLFHFGRIDLRYESLASLRRGQDFRIIEINGVGSEATHVWDPSTTLAAAYRAQFEHYGLAFAIGDRMRAAGHRATSPLELLRLWRHQSRLIASYPMND
jgi:hypothetical protein